MDSVISKRKGNKTYYYVVTSARVNGQPRITSQTYLGTAERLAALVRQQSAPVPLAASAIDLGLPGALWRAAERSGAFAALRSLWPPPRSGPSTAHYLLLAAIHRIYRPGPKTAVAEWYRRSILRSLWGFAPERFSSQAFRDCFDGIQTSPELSSAADDELEQAQSRLLEAWQGKQLLSSRVLAYDTTNFYTWVASTNQRNQLAQRGHNKQGRHNLCQVGLSYVLDGEHGLSLCHHLYAGNVRVSNELSAALECIVRLLERRQIPRKTVTLVLDKGAAALANTLELEQAGLGWITALPWNQAPAELRQRPCEELTPLGSAHPGVRAAAERALVHGKEYLCVVKYSASFASEQLHSLSTSLTKALQSLRRLAVQLAKPKARYTEKGIRNRIAHWLAAAFVSELVSYELERRDGSWQLTFDVDNAALQRLLGERLGRTILLSNRLDWSAAQVVAAYSGQQHIERVLRGLQDSDWLGWGPMYHWSDSKIRVHAFYCMFGISLLQYLHKQAEAVWPGLSMEELIEQLRQIQQFQLLYPPQGKKGPPRAATILSKQTLPQQCLAQALELDQLTASQRSQVIPLDTEQLPYNQHFTAMPAPFAVKSR